MATINFYLDRPNSKDERLILMTYQNRGLKFRYSTKIKIKDKVWDFKSQRIKRNVSGELEINSHLKNLIDKINGIERQALLEEKILSLNYVREQFNDKINKPSVSYGFFDFWQEYIDKSIGFKSAATIRIYKTVKNTLERFTSLYRLNLSFDDINISFYEGYLDYLMNDCNYLNNTIGNHIKTLKSFMSYATSKKYNKNLDYRSFKVFREDVDIMYLTEEELLKIYYLENLSTTHEFVKDNFCFGCFTGLRFSDIARVTKENVRGDYLEIVTQKTKDFIKIPLNKYAKQIIQKYSGGLPHCISNQKTNDCLKEIGEIAELTELIIKRKIKGVKVIEVREPKFKMLTTHAARRTFVTLSLEKGMRPETVMSITGHKDYKSFKKYIKLTDQVRLVEMNKIWNN